VSGKEPLSARPLPNAGSTRSQRRFRDKRVVWPYVLAVSMTLATVAVEVKLAGWMKGQPPASLLIVPVVICAYLGGAGPGLLSTVLAGFCTFSLRVPPAFSFTLLNPADHIRYISVTVAGVLISVLSEALRRALSRAEASDLLRAVTLASIGDAVITADTEGRVTFLNAAAEHLTGWKDHEARGQPLNRVFRIAGREKPKPVEGEKKQISWSGTVVGALNRAVLLAADGRRVHIENTRAPIADFEGVVRGMVVVFRDRSEEERIEAERQQAEEALRQSEEQFRLLFETVDAGVFLTDSKGTVLTGNRTAEEMFDVSMEQVRGKVCSDLFEAVRGDGSPLMPHQTPIQQAIATRKPVIRQTVGVRRAATAGSSMIWLLESARPVLAPDGAVRQVIDTCSPVTALKKVEEALRQSDQFNREVIAGAHEGIVVYDREFRVQVWNPFMEELTGISAAQALGQNALELFPCLREHKIDVLLRRGLEGETVQSPEHFFQIPQSGKSGWLVTIYSPHFDIHGGVIGVISIVQDITERKRADDALRSSQARLQAALKAGGMGTFTWDVQKGRCWWDDTTLKVWGREVADGRIETQLSFLHPEDLPRFRAELEDFVQHPRSEIRSEFRVLRADAAVRWVAVSGRIEQDAARRPERVIGVCTDITDRKRAEEAQLRTQKLEALGTLSSGIAHDFNNILLAVRGNAELAGAGLPPDHPAQRHVAEIAKAGARAADLVRRILAFSRPQQQHRAVTELQPVVEEALDLVRVSLPAGIQIHIEPKPSLPPVAADSTQIHQIVINLVTNAAHAIGDRRGLIDIKLEAVTFDAEHTSLAPSLQAGRYLRLSVSDDGCGMDIATQRRIFDPFFTTKPIGLGTGLGLWVVHDIMKSHGGAIAVYSELGKGTVFHLYFPAAISAVQAAAVEARPALRQHNERLLYVDDEEALIFLAQLGLQRLGYQVSGYTDADLALREFQARPNEFDAVITDVSMPGMSGFELAQALLAVRPDVPIVMTSGFVRPEDQEKAQRIGVRSLTLKPHTIEDLSRRLDQVLRV